MCHLFSEAYECQAGKPLSTFSRPEQVGWWFRNGRCDFNKVPEILSLAHYREMWIRWWKSLQPTWRCPDDISECPWPLPRKLPSDHGMLWEKLLAGGKDGLFVVVMSLSWWILKCPQDGEEISELEKALVDVSWVLANMLSVFPPRALEEMPSFPPHSRPNHSGMKVGLLNKRLRKN